MWKITERMLPSFDRIWANMRYKQRAVGPEKYQLNDFLIGFPSKCLLLVSTYTLNHAIKNFDIMVVIAVTTMVRKNIWNIFEYFLIIL